MAGAASSPLATRIISRACEWLTPISGMGHAVWVYKYTAISLQRKTVPNACLTFTMPISPIHVQYHIPLLSSTTPRHFNSSTVSKPEAASFTRSPLPSGRELTARCMTPPNALTTAPAHPPSFRGGRQRPNEQPQDNEVRGFHPRGCFQLTHTTVVEWLKAR